MQHPRMSLLALCLAGLCSGCVPPGNTEFLLVSRTGEAKVSIEEVVASASMASALAENPTQLDLPKKLFSGTCTGAQNIPDIGSTAGVMVCSDPTKSVAIVVVAEGDVNEAGRFSEKTELFVQRLRQSLLEAQGVKSVDRLKAMHEVRRALDGQGASAVPQAK